MMKTRAPRRRLGALATAMVVGVGLVGLLAPAALAQDDGATDDAPSGQKHRGPLSEEQRACLEEQGVQKPERSEDGERVPPTDEQREAFRAAAEACGIELPIRRHPRLTDEQRACLEEQGVQKPERSEDGERVPPTDEQREAFRAAAEACGIELPERPPSGGDEATEETSA